jgi:integrase
MPRPSKDFPSYLRHSVTGLAFCRVRLASGQRRDIYLGAWNSPASKAEHARIVALVVTNHGVYPEASPDQTVNEALVRYVSFIDVYYRDSTGQPTTTLRNTKVTLGYLRRLFGPTPLVEFGPPELKAIRETMVNEGRVRKQINKHINTIRQFFRWCVEERLVPPDVLSTLRAVSPLMPGRSGAVEGKPRQPANPSDVEKTLPFMPPAVRAVVQLLRLTGSRPTEILILRPHDLDRSSEVWRYTPAQHKGAWRGRPRVIFFGPEAKVVLAPWLLGCADKAYVFSPKRSEELRNRRRSENRRVMLWPAHAKRNAELKARGNCRQPMLAERFNHQALALAVRRACDRAGVARFCPYQLRHLRAVELREKYGLEFVRATLGQTYLSMSDHYSKAADEALASKAAAEVG